MNFYSYVSRMATMHKSYGVSYIKLNGENVGNGLATDWVQSSLLLLIAIMPFNAMYWACTAVG